jgi:hypothetical protein
MAIFPVPVIAVLSCLTWKAVRLDVRAAAPALVVLIAGNLMSVDPTDAHVPFERVTGREVAGLSLASLRASDPDPVVYAWIVAVPLAPALPIFACHDAPTVAAPTGGATVITRMAARDSDRPTPSRRRPRDVARIDPTLLTAFLGRDLRSVSPVARRGPGDQGMDRVSSPPAEWTLTDVSGVGE